MSLRKIVLGIFLLISLFCQGQEKYKPLSIGDTVPNVVFDFLNRSVLKRNLASYKGQLLIIDCWSIYCAPCIRALPEFAILQNKLGNKLNLLALEGGSPRPKVVDFLNKREADGRKIELPVGHIEDRKNSVFYSLFPVLNYGFPVEIWIDPNGILVGITSSHLVNEAMINRVLLKDYSGLTTRHYQKDFKKDKFLLVNNNGGPDSAFVYRSMITRFNDSISGIDLTCIQKENRNIRLFFANRNILDLVKVAYYKGKTNDTYNKLLDLRVRDSINYKRPKIGPDSFSLLKERAYCYELILPPDRTIDEAYGFMLNDLQKYFKISIQANLRETKCLVLEKNKKDVLKSKGGKTEYRSEELENGAELIEVNNNNFKILLSLLNREGYPIVVDNTGILYPVDFKFKFQKNYDFNTLNQTLMALGLKITQRMINQQVLTISDQE